MAIEIACAIHYVVLEYFMQPVYVRTMADVYVGGAGQDQMVFILMEDP